MGKVRKAKELAKDEKPRKKFKKESPHKKKDSTKHGKDKDSKTADSTSSPAAESSEKWSKSKKKRMRKIMGKLKKEKAGGNSGDTTATSQNNNTPTTSTTGTHLPSHASSENLATTTPAATSKSKNTKKKTNPIQEAFKARLAGSRFRILNEELYTTTSEKSYHKFKENPELFEQYHEGFRHQVESWPENPVDVMVASLTTTYNSKNNNKKSSAALKPCVVADFGCGDAKLAKDLLAVKRKNKQKGQKPEQNASANAFQVHSFDLVSPNELVTACDMADVPLANKSVDACVFCLSLMGTNLADFIREAHRVLKDDGRVKIAEVRSRIEYSHGRKGMKNNNASTTKTNGKKESSSSDGAAAASTTTNKTEGTLEEFTGVLGKLGFECVRTDRTNTMFLLLELKKNGKKPDKNLEFSAKPCIYKRR
uniref:Ribosomal RNA-processing protein 8 n=1 Tax=Pseudo-nitzschia australis TaxID=44445 RepID=A0A7S4EK72_9STRA|mmetsp:Transcript_2418/g.5251  ORF Transcript_2418/g.5251 Transcript_2418/m.5251 type:complete len:424 (+) Transcript_2418:237-1508(+)|eukprot:CAMPEP_0168171948 /NCGR_PEP_ID=MMETSP0139_2-20121125/4975_1 /TAXON_ID=44445 /ORGANISM="Pseudo-nitzschia australis, Strain 10249 10 AB" /LENGTH=423 /DNA_ID=CAMNT_0008089531 /DNA_START=216 /DNA_END=1487 /DNA_ORIENTATION=-